MVGGQLFRQQQAEKLNVIKELGGRTHPFHFIKWAQGGGCLDTHSPRLLLYDFVFPGNRETKINHL
jgi:hypothetical protein